MGERETDVVVVGGGLGGIAAALAVLEAGYRVVLTEPTAWLGGQLTSQAVPPDEHQWIETAGLGATRSYQRLRQRIRQYYGQNYPGMAESAQRDDWSPGRSWVSRLAHEPRVALRVIEDLLAPYQNSGRVKILLHHYPIRAEVDGDRIRAIIFASRRTGTDCSVVGQYFLDASELGELLPLAGVEHVTGSESGTDTKEAHASLVARPDNMQAVTWVAAVEFCQGEDHTIAPPAQYSYWRSYQPQLQPPWPGPLFSWKSTGALTGQPVTRTMFGSGESAEGNERQDGWWHYRRIVDASIFGSLYPNDLSLINWPQNDYFEGPLYGTSETSSDRHWQGARTLTLAWIYWLQTEAPRSDGGLGYPGIRLRPDVLGSDDGLALYPYIRESRRIRARFTIREPHVSLAVHPDGRAEPFLDSVGVGAYPIDLHPTTEGDNSIHVPTAPFQIPLGSLLPVRVINVLAAGKTIGTTHVTNGCYRVHPVEWNIGEAAGSLAAYCLQHQVLPAVVWERPDHLRALQAWLRARGIPLHWPHPLP